MTIEAQMRHPNFMQDGKLYLVRCFVCDPEFGRENWAPAVASSSCAWCGWSQPVSDAEAESLGQFNAFAAP